MTITSRSGEVLCEWPRAHSKGLWQTNPDHLPAGYKGTLEWNGPHFRQKAAAVGPYTSRVIEGACPAVNTRSRPTASASASLDMRRNTTRKHWKNAAARQLNQEECLIPSFGTLFQV